MTRTRFFLAKPNQTGLTKTKQRFFRLHTTQKNRSKSKMSSKPSIFKDMGYGLMDPRKSAIAILLVRYMDKTGDKNDSRYFFVIFLSVEYPKVEKRVIFDVFLPFREPSPPYRGPNAKFPPPQYRIAPPGTSVGRKWHLRAFYFPGLVVLDRNSAGLAALFALVCLPCQALAQNSTHSSTYAPPGSATVCTSAFFSSSLSSASVLEAEHAPGAIPLKTAAMATAPPSQSPRAQPRCSAPAA